MDWLCLLFAVLSGVGNGTFPVFIKTKKVLAAGVHPVVFQFYKSAWVCLFGVSLIVVRLIRQQPLSFTPWAAASAAAWIPAGVTTIIAVPLIGVGSAVLATSAVSSTLSFLVFWLIFHESVKVHDIFGLKFPIAPFYLLGALLGMGGLIWSQQFSARQLSNAKATAGQKHSGIEPDAKTPLISVAGDDAQNKNRICSGSRLLNVTLGFGAASLAGFFSSLQYGVVSVGRLVTQTKYTNATSTALDEQFDALGCWTGAFGVSALVCTLAAWAVVSLWEFCHSRPAPSLQLRVMWAPGAGAGVFWSMANLFATLAVLRDGNALVMAQINAASLIVSGLWGLLWYREIQGRAVISWIVSALFTGTMIVLLGFEKGS